MTHKGRTLCIILACAAVYLLSGWLADWLDGRLMAGGAARGVYWGNWLLYGYGRLVFQVLPLGLCFVVLLRVRAGVKAAGDKTFGWTMGIIAAGVLLARAVIGPPVNVALLEMGVDPMVMLRNKGDVSWTTWGDIAVMAALALAGFGWLLSKAIAAQRGE